MIHKLMVITQREDTTQSFPLMLRNARCAIQANVIKCDIYIIILYILSFMPLNLRRHPAIWYAGSGGKIWKLAFPPLDFHRCRCFFECQFLVASL